MIGMLAGSKQYHRILLYKCALVNASKKGMLCGKVYKRNEHVVNYA